MKHAIYQLDYMDNIFKLIMPKSNDKGEYISVEQGLAELKRLQVKRKLNRCIDMLRSVSRHKYPAEKYKSR